MIRKKIKYPSHCCNCPSIQYSRQSFQTKSSSSSSSTTTTATLLLQLLRCDLHFCFARCFIRCRLYVSFSHRPFLSMLHEQGLLFRLLNDDIFQCPERAQRWVRFDTLQQQPGDMPREREVGILRLVQLWHTGPQGRVCGRKGQYPGLTYAIAQVQQMKWNHS